MKHYLFMLVCCNVLYLINSGCNAFSASCTYIYKGKKRMREHEKACSRETVT